MTHTEVLTEDHRRRQFENRINAAVRHCRIGKVVEKKPPRHAPDWDRKTIDGLCGRGQVKPGGTLWYPPFPGVFSLPPMSGGVSA